MIVRNSWVVRSYRGVDVGFFDKSVLEPSRRVSADALKRFLREGLEGTSVTCVLAGTQTWQRRWVRYEIARSVIKTNGLLTVHINGVSGRYGLPSARGRDPLSATGLYRSLGSIYLCEERNGKWIKNEDYKLDIPARSLWFEPPTSNGIIKLSRHCLAYDFARQKGHNNMAGWIETSAGIVSR